MPELPEVEVLRESLEPHVVQERVLDVHIYNPHLRRPIDPELPRLMRGQRILTVIRRGKYVGLRTVRGVLMIHLGMTGSLVRCGVKEALGRHDHVDIAFARHRLRYQDPRRFGSIEWQEGALENYPPLAKLGPEPLDTAHFTPAALHRALQRRSCSMKQALMNANVVAGIGNIYASEILFRAKVHPLQRASSVSLRKCEAIIREARLVLREAIAAGGSSISDYVDAQGHQGSYQKQHRVYGRAGQSCPVCGRTIERLELGGRASFFCPRCQRI